jgi:phospholipid-binding lipoprotein MlaA
VQEKIDKVQDKVEKKLGVQLAPKVDDGSGDASETAPEKSDAAPKGDAAPNNPPAPAPVSSEPANK